MGEMLRTYLGSVQTWECDANGHMNVQFYVSRGLQSLGTVEVCLGIAPQDGHALVAQEHHLRFYAEQRPPEPHEVRTGVVRADADRLTLYSEMRNTKTGGLIATIMTEARLLARETRAPRALTAEMLTAARELLVEVPEHGKPRGLAMGPPRDNPTLAEAERIGMQATYQGMVLNEECDPWGWMGSRSYMARVHEAVQVLVGQLNRGDTESGGKLGGAALEYRLIYHDTPRLGDALAVYSGIGTVRGKAYNWIHWLCDLRTGRAVATMENVAVTLNLETRKAIDIPEPMLVSLKERQVEGLTP